MLKVAHSPSYAHSLPQGHRFPMEKYSLLPEQLIHEGTLKQENFFVPDFLEEKWIINTHDPDYFSRLKNLELTRTEIRATGFPLSAELVHREIQIATGSVQAALFALEYGIGMNIAGGTHHASTNRGEGFCLLNDIAITANYLIENHLAKRVLVVDLDVHQGNGTAQIFQNRTEIFTFSMHGAKNYPHHKEKSHLDVELPDGIVDEAYMEKLSFHLPTVFDQFSPDFIIYQCGVDVLGTDQLGRLNLSQKGVKLRDEFMLSSAQKERIPIMCCMGGGYSKQIKVIIEAHAQVFRLAQELYA